MQHTYVAADLHEYVHFVQVPYKSLLYRKILYSFFNVHFSWEHIESERQLMQ